VKRFKKKTKTKKKHCTKHTILPYVFSLRGIHQNVSVEGKEGGPKEETQQLLRAHSRPPQRARRRKPRKKISNPRSRRKKLPTFDKISLGRTCSDSLEGAPILKAPTRGGEGVTGSDRARLHDEMRKKKERQRKTKKSQSYLP